jgi:hypothetical protein
MDRGHGCHIQEQNHCRGPGAVYLRAQRRAAALEYRFGWRGCICQHMSNSSLAYLRGLPSGPVNGDRPAQVTFAAWEALWAGDGLSAAV